MAITDEGVLLDWSGRTVQGLGENRLDKNRAARGLRRAASVFTSGSQIDEK